MTYPELTEAQASWRFTPDAALLKDRNILITGAGAGIGAALAKVAALHGANVILLGRTRERLETVFDWISEATDTSPVIVPCDLNELAGDNVAALYDSISSTYGALHGLVHNASLLGPKVPLAHYPNKDWADVMQVNVNAPFLLTSGLFPLMDTEQGCVCIFVSSSVGRQGRAYWGAYSASKFALEGLSQIFADETENAGNIRVYSVNPGGTRTRMRSQAYPMEDPASVPTPESHMDLFLYLLGGNRHGKPLPDTGSQLDCRTWTGSP